MRPRGVAFVAAVMCFMAQASFGSLDYWPTTGWRASTPEEQGMDSTMLAESLAALNKNPINIHSLLIVRHGYMVVEAYFAPFMQGSQHDVASVTKSVTATLTGIAAHKGLIRSLDEPILDFFPQRTAANLDDRKKAMTVAHLLTMSSGLTCITSPGEVTLMQMMASPDWVQFMLDQPMQDEPGTRFVYNSGGVHLLSAILHQAAGMNEVEFAKQNLFGPLGITNVAWPLDPTGTDNHGWGDLRLTPPDMAKLGLLYLDGGHWDGRQVLSPEWVAAATKPHVATSNRAHPGYGYLWWINDGAGFAAVGRGGQRINVMPDRDLVVVTTSGTDNRTIDQTLPTQIVAAVKSPGPLPPNPSAVDLLSGEIKKAAVRNEKPQPVPKLPKLARRIAGKTYTLEANPFGLASFSLEFPKKDEAFVRITSAGGAAGGAVMQFAVGLDDVFRMAKGREGLPAAGKGSWKDDKTFAMQLDEIGHINRWIIMATFDENNVTLLMRSLSGLGELTLTGKMRADAAE
ncbi:MAG TPA: serine hydrolase [Candidatus Bathyarchaeia archaeon]|nr:serine hydrolase [Candidatus Bathyarchaeia archaeon]